MMSRKPRKYLDAAAEAASLWPLFLHTRDFILLLAACAAIPACADTIPNKSSVHAVSEAALTADGTAPVSRGIPHSFFDSGSILLPVPDVSGEQNLSHEQTVTSSQGLHPDEGVRLRSDPGIVIQRGMASWYGPGFHGRKSANGERFNMHSMTAAHPNLPLLSWVLVRNVRNNKVALLKVTDRGPYRSKRILDVSYAAAKQLDFVRSGTTQVEIRQLSHSEASWVRRQLDEGIDVSAEDGSHSSVNAGDDSAAKEQQQEQPNGRD